METPAAAESDVSDAEQFKARFHAKYAELVASGVAPNEAAALVLQELQHLVPPPAPSSSFSSTTASAADASPAVAIVEDAHAPSPASPSSGSAPTSPPQLPSAPATQSTAEQQMDQQIESSTAASAPVPSADVDMEDTDDEEQLELAMALSTAPHHTDAPSAKAAAPPALTPPVPPAPPVPRISGPPLGSQLQQALHAAATSDEYRDVKRLVYAIFSDLDALNSAFVTSTDTDTVDGDDKWWGVDHALLTDVYAQLSAAMQQSGDQTALQNTLRNALETLVTQPWNVCSTWSTPASLRFVLVLLEHPAVFDPDYLPVVGGLCKLVYHSSVAAKTLLREHWRTHFDNDELTRLLQVLQQAITVCLYGSKKMDLVYACCSVLKELHTINSALSEPFATYDEFYNDAVNNADVVDIIDDYARSLTFLQKRHAIATRSREPFVAPPRLLAELSFCDFPFVLDAGSKSRILQVDSDLEQRARAQDAVLSEPMLGLASQYLILKVRRTHVIEDSLQQLVRLSAESLKKPLKVKFIGEEGVDEGGVRKEFFQILIRQLLDPAFGMFTYDDETHSLWFNSDSLEATMEFELIGILLGIAIYNGVILDVHFPHTVYKKLMECPMTLDDVEVAMPALGRGLRQLLAFDGSVEDVFQRSFEYSYEVFGAVKTVELKPGGSAIAVTNANRDEYVALYVEYVLTKSVARQYDAFHRGFHLVCNGDVLQMFRWEELHLTICGSPDLDFEALEDVTHYDDGYTEESECIRNFWSVVHEFSLEDKKKLLMFATGSDRVPIRGLSNMVFVISRNGSDSDRLPSAHTCFNHLLLPEYSSREKLKERLLLAITQSEGFGLR